MRLLDKILLSLAVSSLSAILLIFFTGEINSKHYRSYLDEDLTVVDDSETHNLSNIAFEKEENSEQPVATAKEQALPDNNELVIYDRHVDEAIEKYFKTIQNNPTLNEEEKRIIETQEVLEGVTEPEDIEPGQSAREKTTLPVETAPQKYFFTRKHKVKKGESVWRIARQYDVPVYTVVSANPDKAKKIIQPGDTLTIPNRKGVFYKVKKGDSLSRIAARFKGNVKDVKQANDITGSKIVIGERLFIPGVKPLPTVRYINKKMFIWPVKGRLTSRFGWRRHPFNPKRKNYHTGIDISAVTGTPILAAASGVVVFAGNGGQFGKLAIIRHKNGYLTAYAHASKLHVKKGQAVKQGQKIARVGSTGLSTGPHLHFEIRRQKKRINPLVAMKKRIKVAVKN